VIGEREREKCGELTATVAFATKSPKQLPIAKIVNPKIASEIPKICPKVYREPSSILFTFTRHRE